VFFRTHGTNTQSVNNDDKKKRDKEKGRELKPVVAKPQETCPSNLPRETRLWMKNNNTNLTNNEYKEK
jgi:hypothetical protein